MTKHEDNEMIFSMIEEIEARFMEIEEFVKNSKIEEFVKNSTIENSKIEKTLKYDSSRNTFDDGEEFSWNLGDDVFLDKDSSRYKSSKCIFPFSYSKTIHSGISYPLSYEIHEKTHDISCISHLDELVLFLDSKLDEELESDIRDSFSSSLESRYSIEIPRDEKRSFKSIYRALREKTGISMKFCGIASSVNEDYLRVRWYLQHT